MTNRDSTPISAVQALSSRHEWPSPTPGTVLGKPVEVIFADHQNKADIGAAIARQWFDAEKVDMIIGFDNSAVALAVEQLAAERNRIAIAGAVGSMAFTGKACTPTEASWMYDSYALTTSLA